MAVVKAIPPNKLKKIKAARGLAVSFILSPSRDKFDGASGWTASFGGAFQATDTLGVSHYLHLADLDVHRTIDVAGAIQLAGGGSAADFEEPEQVAQSQHSAIGAGVLAPWSLYE
jgi:hypothetical protein